MCVFMCLFICICILFKTKLFISYLFSYYYHLYQLSYSPLLIFYIVFIFYILCVCYVFVYVLAYCEEINTEQRNLYVNVVVAHLFLSSNKIIYQIGSTIHW
eukprot:92601_1